MLYLVINHLILIFNGSISNVNIIDEIIISVFMILVVLFFFSVYYSFDNNNLYMHIYFFIKKDIPINKIFEVRYIFFGIYKLSIYRFTLNEKGTIFITLFLTKKQSNKKLKRFFEILKEKNISCIIDI